MPYLETPYGLAEQLPQGVSPNFDWARNMVAEERRLRTASGGAFGVQGYDRAKIGEIYRATENLILYGQKLKAALSPEVIRRAVREAIASGIVSIQTNDYLANAARRAMGRPEDLAPWELGALAQFGVPFEDVKARMEVEREALNIPPPPVPPPAAGQAAQRPGAAAQAGAGAPTVGAPTNPTATGVAPSGQGRLVPMQLQASLARAQIFPGTAAPPLPTPATATPAAPTGGIGAAAIFGAGAQNVPPQTDEERLREGLAQALLRAMGETARISGTEQTELSRYLAAQEALANRILSETNENTRQAIREAQRAYMASLIWPGAMPRYQSVTSPLLEAASQKRQAAIEALNALRWDVAQQRAARERALEDLRLQAASRLAALGVEPERVLMPSLNQPSQWRYFINAGRYGYIPS